MPTSPYGTAVNPRYRGAFYILLPNWAPAPERQGAGHWSSVYVGARAAHFGFFGGFSATIEINNLGQSAGYPGYGWNNFLRFIFKDRQPEGRTFSTLGLSKNMQRAYRVPNLIPDVHA